MNTKEIAKITSKFYFLFFSTQLQIKYEEMENQFNLAESEKAKIKKELVLVNVKLKNIEESYSIKSKENETLKSQINELVKNSII